MAEPGLLELLQCPRCRRAPLRPAAGGLACAGCGIDYPLLGGIPWLFADPVGALGDWRNRLTLYLEEFAAAERAAAGDLALARRASTRARLTRLRDAYGEQRRLVADLLSPLALAPLPLPRAATVAFETRLPLTQDLHSYYANAHRDWCWGGAENDASFEIASGSLSEGTQRLLVLGAGACRLAYDLHQHSARPLTVALDINPLLLLTARTVAAGGRVTLYEFPLAPRAPADVAVRRELAAPSPARPGLEFVFADAWRAPFAPQSFDAVLTPWLLDIVDEDLEAVASAINRLLAPGGRWVNFGSLAFPWRQPSRRYGVEEVADILVDAGFELTSHRDVTLPYMCSPASRHGRLETVACFAADKRRRSTGESPQQYLAPWLIDTARPVPRTAQLALAADASRIQAVLLALIDGKRSIDDLARIVSADGLMPGSEAASAVRGLLERLHAAGERGSLA